MNFIKDARFVLKMQVVFRLATPLLLRSGQAGEDTDSSIARTPDRHRHLHINGYVWAALLRRTLGRLEQGHTLAKTIGKFNERQGVSPLWCEHSLADIENGEVSPGNRIDRKWGAAQATALFSDELVMAGVPLTLHGNLFVPDAGHAKEWRAALLDAFKVIDAGIENIGGGWSYGYGRLRVEAVRFAHLDLEQAEQRRRLWQWQNLDWQDAAIPDQFPATQAELIKVSARVAPGQLLAVKSAVFPLDGQHFGKLPDSFVMRRNRREGDDIVQGPVIPGKAIRQALLSVPLERKWRSLGEEICLSTTHGRQRGEEERCTCRRCKWFGSTDAAGIIAVTEATVRRPEFEVVNRVQLCEHSMQNMNLFAGEYLKGGDFEFQIIIDEKRRQDAGADCLNEIVGLLEEMKGVAAPPGWYRVGGTATCTGQVQVVDYEIFRGDTHVE